MFMWLKYSEQCLEPCSTCINYYYHVILKLKRQYFGNLRQKDNSLEKTLMLGKIEGKRRRRQQGMRWLNNITHSMDMNLRKLQETVKDREAWHAAFHRVTKNWTRRSNWPTTIVFLATSIKKDMWMLMIFLQIAKLNRFFNFTPSSSYVLYKISTMNCTL